MTQAAALTREAHLPATIEKDRDISHVTGLPSGTVTVLFTDIEGSVERRERDSQALWLVAERHIVLLDEPIKAHGRVHFKTVGDAVQAAATLQGERLETT